MGDLWPLHDRTVFGMRPPLLWFRRRCRPFRRRRHDMDDVIAARLQLIQYPWQCTDGSRLDVVKQKNAFSPGLEPLDREIVHARGGNMPPIVSQKIGTPDLD